MVEHLLVTQEVAGSNPVHSAIFHLFGVSMSKAKASICKDCSNKAVVGRARCQACLDKNKLWRRKKVSALRAAGCCVNCQAKVDAGQFCCVDCRKVNSERALKKFLKSHQNGQCRDCFKRKRMPDKARCALCESKRLKRRAEQRDQYFTELLVTANKRKKKGKKPIGLIYRVHCPLTQKSYIGQSIDFENRMKDHVNKALRGVIKTPFASALKKYGPEAFDWEILSLCYNREELNAREHYYIKQFRSLVGQNGYNINDGMKVSH